MSMEEQATVGSWSGEVRRAVEAILMVAIDPVPANLLAQLLNHLLVLSLFLLQILDLRHQALVIVVKLVSLLLQFE